MSRRCRVEGCKKWATFGEPFCRDVGCKTSRNKALAAEIASEKAEQIVKGETTTSTNIHLTQRASAAHTTKCRYSLMSVAPQRKPSKTAQLLKRPSLTVQLKHRQGQAENFEEANKNDNISCVGSDITVTLSPRSTAAWQLRQGIPSAAACVAFFSNREHDPAIVGLTDELQQWSTETPNTHGSNTLSKNTESLVNYFGSGRKCSQGTQKLLSTPPAADKCDARSQLLEGEVRRLELVEKRSLLEAAYGVEAVRQFMSNATIGVGSQWP